MRGFISAITLSVLIGSVAKADSSFPPDPSGQPHTFPGEVPEDCDIIDVTISLEKWRSYHGPFVDFDVPHEFGCVLSSVYHPLIKASVNLMCGDSLRTVDWRFHGGGTSGAPIRDMPNEVPERKLSSLSPIDVRGFPKRLSAESFNKFLETYDRRIKNGGLGEYAWNPDAYDCTNELNCGGYFLIVLKEMMQDEGIERSIEELADELEESLDSCEHFAWELSGNPSQYEDALAPAFIPQCTDDSYTSEKDKNCYRGPDGLCYEDPTTTYCNGAVQSTNPDGVCYLEPEQQATAEPTPQACNGTACTTPTPIPQSTATPAPTICSGGVGSCGSPTVTPTPLLAVPPITCQGRFQTSTPNGSCYVKAEEEAPLADQTPLPCVGYSCRTPHPTPLATASPTPILCASGAIRNDALCAIPVVEAPEHAPRKPEACNGMTQTRNPKAPCYLAPSLTS